MNEELRARFERVAYDHYRAERTKRTINDDTEQEAMPEQLFWRQDDGTYGVRSFNTAWWGYQAGFVDGALAGTK